MFVICCSRVVNRQDNLLDSLLPVPQGVLPIQLVSPHANLLDSQLGATPFRHILSTHPVYAYYQHTLPTHPVYAYYHHILSTQPF